MVANVQYGGTRNYWANMDNVNRYDHCMRPVIVMNKIDL